MKTTAQQMRAWRGPALFSYGFRPFFLGAGLWAAAAMAGWIAMLSGQLTLPMTFDPVSWHAHELLFGYLGAVMAGFLLTAVPNWTGRLPIVGWPLAGLFALWVAGRIAIIGSRHLPPLGVAIADLALPMALAAALLREIIAGRNWRNLGVLGLLAVFALGNALFHHDAARGGFAAEGPGFRLGLAAAIMLIALVGGRIVPSFTRNWLIRNNPGRLPAPPVQVVDKLALLALAMALLAWMAAPGALLTAIGLALAGGLHLVRLARWAGDRTVREPLLWVLHLGYAFVPLGALALAAARITPALATNAAAQHLWMAGAIGLMTLAVMTRATRGHSKRELSAGPGTAALYLALLTAVAARVASGPWPAAGLQLHMLAGAAWIVAFGGFTLLYGPMLWRRH